MTPFFQKLLRAGVNIETVIKRVRERIGRLFRSKAEVARRPFGRLETRERREMEAERLDRLRNPSDYQGK